MGLLDMIKSISGSQDSKEADESLAFNVVTDLTIEASAGDSLPSIVPIEVLAYTGGILETPNYGKTVIDLGGLEASEETPLLIDHKKNTDGFAGMGVSQNDGKSIQFTGGIATETKAGDGLMKGHRGGLKYQASVGVLPERGSVEHVAPGRVVEVNGQSFKAGPEGLRVARKARLKEVTITPLGLDENTKVRIAASESANETAEAEAEAITRQGEVAMATVESSTENQEIEASASTQQVQEIQAAPHYTREQIDAAVEAASDKAFERAFERFEAENSRRQAIEAAAGGNREVLSQAIEGGWDEHRTKLAAITHATPTISFTRGLSADGAPKQSEVIEASLMINAGEQESDLQQHFSDDTIEAALSKEHRGFGLHALCYAAMQAAGRRVTPGVFTNETLQSALEADREIRASGESQYSVSGITGNVANKFVVSGWNSVERVWERIAAIASVNDFKENSFYSLTGDFTYEKVNKTGQLKSADMDELKYTNQADTRGKIFALDRKTLINDDVNAIRQTARLKLGRGAGLDINKIFWTTFLNDSGFFGTGLAVDTKHGVAPNDNLVSGATSALSIDSLSKAREMFLKQIDPDGDPVDLDASILLVPPALEVLAGSLYNDAEVRDTTASKKATTGNPHRGRYQPLMSRYLDNAKIAGGSSTAFYLLADPAALDIGAVQMVFLNGRRRPFIDQTEADFDTLGIKMRGYHDFGVRLMERRAGVKFAGV